MKDSIFAIRRTLQNYTNGGYVLIMVTVLAMIIANSPLASAYFSWWNVPVSLQIGGFNLFSHHGEPMTLMQFINDALMAIFFFSIGLEIKREVLVGELSSVKQALLPVIAAIGGIVLPILIFRIVADGEDMLRGSAIPMATDIAFSLGVLSMLGRRVPIGLKIFLATLAVADDVGGILAIAIFYSGEIYFTYLLYAFGLLVVLLMGSRLHINSKMFYILIGIAVWFLFLNSGIHPTIAGVLVAFCVPAHPVMHTEKFINKIRSTIAQFPASENQEKGEAHILSKDQLNLLKCVESASDKVISPLQDLEDTLHPLVNYLIIPLFAFANAGIALGNFDLSSVFQGVSLAIFCGLFFGKFIGIFSFTFVAIKMRWVSMPHGATWKTIAGAAALGGIGFTVSLFIANLSFGDMFGGELLLNQAKMGILLGSLLSGILGYTLLNLFLPKELPEEEV
ncbi:Na+/H+ antiporter NhaA [Coprobacter sp.]